MYSPNKNLTSKNKEKNKTSYLVLTFSFHLLTFSASIRNISAMNTIYKWIETELPVIANKLNSIIKKDTPSEQCYRLGLSGKAEIHKILDRFLEALFPRSYCNSVENLDEQPFFLTNALRAAATGLHKHATLIFTKESDCNKVKAQEKAFQITRQLFETLPKIRQMIVLDIDCAFAGDPAAKSREEIILSYPFIEAIATHRIAHCLYSLKLPVIPRIMSEQAHSQTGIDIHPGATIQAGFFIDHGTGVVIGETCRIGKNVKIYQGVTLGALSPFDQKGNPLRDTKRHPDIEDDVIIYANATILGGNTIIGKGAIIGGNCWITKSIPPNAIVFHQNEIKIKNRE